MAEDAKVFLRRAVEGKEVVETTLPTAVKDEEVVETTLPTCVLTKITITKLSPEQIVRRSRT